MVERTLYKKDRETIEGILWISPSFKSMIGQDGIRRTAFIFACGEYNGLKDLKGALFGDLTESVKRDLEILEPFFKAAGYGVNVHWHPKASILKGIIKALKVMHDEKCYENDEAVRNGTFEKPMEHQVQIYFSGHGVMKKGMTCMVLPTPDGYEDKTWYERINVFDLEFYVKNELGRLKNLKVVVYFDCCRVEHIARAGEEEEVTAVDGFAGNLAFISGCDKNAKVYVKQDGADSIANKIAKKWTICSKDGRGTFADFQRNFKIFIESQLDDQESYVVLDPAD